MFSTIRNLLHIGISPEHQTLERLSRKMYNIDLLAGIVFPFIAFLLYFSFGEIPEGMSFLAVLVPVYFLLNIFVVSRGYYYSSVLTTFFVNYALVIVCGFLMKPILVPFIGIAVAINALIFFPMKHRFSIIMFSVFMVTCLGLGFFDFYVKFNQVQSLDQLSGLIGPPLIIFALLFFYKIFSLVVMYHSIIQLKKRNFNKYHALFEYNPTAMLEISKDLKIRKFNSNFVDLIGFSRSDIEKKSILDLLSDSNQKLFLKTIERLKWNPHKGYESQLELIHRNGQQIASNLSIRINVDDTGQWTNALLSIWDVTEMTRTQDALKQNEALLSAVLNATSNTRIWSIDRLYRLTSINDQFAKELNEYFGLNSKTGDPALKGIPESTLKYFKAHYDRAFNGESHVAHKQYWSGTDQELYIKFNFIPIKNRDNQITGCAVYAADLTKEKQTEKALRESEQSFKRIFVENPQGIHVSDTRNGVRYVRSLMKKGVTDIRSYLKEHPEELPNVLDRSAFAANDRIVEIFDMDDSEDYLKNYASYKSKASYDTMFGEIQAFMDGDPSYEGEAIIETKAGNTKHIYYKVVFPNDPENEKFIYNIQDITVRKQVQKALELSEMRYRTLFNNAFDGIIVYDLKKQRSTEANDKIKEMFGVPIPEFLERPPGDFMPEFQEHGAKSDILLKQHLKTIEARGSLQYNWMHKKQDGQLFQTEVSATLLPAPQNHIIVFVFKDITEKIKKDEILMRAVKALKNKKLELERYIESNMQLENFAHMASHDLQAPIRTLVSFSNLLEKNAAQKLNLKELEYLGFIVSAAKNMKELIDALLTYSRVNSQKKEFSSIQLPMLLSQMMEELRINIEEAQAEIVVHDLPDEIFADPGRLRQLFQNLITNALKFSRPGQKPLIEITGEERADHFLFKIKDNGIGIDAQFHDRIFLLFRKLHSNEKYQGTGIGLSVCKKVINQHNGKIWVESQKGKGTTFHFTISKFLQENNVLAISPNYKNHAITV